MCARLQVIAVCPSQLKRGETTLSRRYDDSDVAISFYHQRRLLNVCGQRGQGQSHLIADAE